jgi:hypothetical protein
MANVPVKISRAIIVRDGARPSQGQIVEGVTLPPINQEGTNPSGGGGASDPNKVSYNQADGKNATERNQARANIGSTSATPQIITDSGAINNLAITSNNLVFTGSNVVLSGIVAGQDGEEITIVNTNSTALSILSQSTLSDANNRIVGSLFVPQNSVVRVKYRTTLNRYVIEALGSLDNRFLRKDVEDTQNGGLNVIRSTGNPTVTIDSLAASGRCLVLRKIGTSSSNQIFTIQNNLEGTPVTVAQMATSGLMTFENQVVVNSTITHNRSNSPNRSIRRDEQPYRMTQNIDGTGQLDNLAINADTGCIEITAATILTGIIPENITNRVREIIVFNRNGGTLDIINDSTDSTAANRFAIGSNISLGNNEGRRFTYIQSRWRAI